MDPDCLVESVPNFSEGRREAVIDEIVAAFAGAHPDVLMLDRSCDPDHDRSAVTLACPPGAPGAARRARRAPLCPPDPPHPPARRPPPHGGLRRAPLRAARPPHPGRL